MVQLERHAQLLPYLEQRPLYDAVNFSFSTYPFDDSMSGVVNDTVFNTRISTFLCPSDGRAGQANINSYHASIGSTTVGYPAGGQTTGVFGVRNYDHFYDADPPILAGSGSPAYGVRDITDGTSNTIAFGEACVGSAPDLSKGPINGLAGAPGVRCQGPSSSMPRRTHPR